MRRPDAARRRVLGFVVGVLAVWVIVSCGSSSEEPAAAEQSSATLRIGSFDFAESELLAELYAQVVESAGIPVTRLGAVGPREIVRPALESGSIDLIPEYLGTALLFAGHDSPPADVQAAVSELADLLRPRGLVVLEPAPAQDVNVFVVHRETAAARDLVKMSDLAEADLSRFGGPVECPDRPLCLVGIAETYGVEFDEFVPQTSLMFTAESLRRGEIDIGLLFSTSPELDDLNLKVLSDDLRLQPPENLVPVIREAALDRWGQELAQSLNEVLGQLTTSELRRLNRMVAAGQPLAEVAGEWLDANQAERGGS